MRAGSTFPPSAVRRSPFAVRRSPFAAHRPPPPPPQSPTNAIIMPPLPPLCLVLLLLSILFQTSTAAFIATTSKFSASKFTVAHAVKAVDYLGPALNAAQAPYNSTLNSAPLQLLSLDKTLCSEILSGTITSRTFFNSTVLVDAESLLSVCHFSWLYENPTDLYKALADAGCSAIIIVTINNVPGEASKLGSASFYDSRSHNYQVNYQDTVPFLAIGREAGSVLKQRLVSHPDEPIHTSFAMDNNRWFIMYSTWLNWLYNVFIGGLACAALYRAIRVGVAPSLTTKGLVVACELPAILYFLWMSIRGHPVYTGADPTLLLACGDGLVFLGLASKILVARFWRAYHVHLKLGAGNKFVDPGKPAERQRKRFGTLFLVRLTNAHYLTSIQRKRRPRSRFASLVSRLLRSAWPAACGSTSRRPTAATPEHPLESWLYPSSSPTSPPPATSCTPELACSGR